MIGRHRPIGRCRKGKGEAEGHLEAATGADGPSGSSSGEATFPDLAGDYRHGPGQARDERGVTLLVACLVMASGVSPRKYPLQLFACRGVKATPAWLINLTALQLL
jgi:hypothetical protein